jgi:ankyrin repeat protein
MESSPTEAANSVDLAESTAMTLVTHVLGFHKLLLGASTYNTDPLKEETDHDKKKKRAIDWDRFLVMFQSLETTMRVAAAELSLNPWGCHLLHIVCICWAPPDVVQVLLSVSTLPLTKKCGMAMEATPLHLACFFGCKAATVSQLLQADTDREALRMKDSQGRIPLHLACQNKGTEKESAKTVHLLLESDASKKSFAMIDRIGETPLQLACQLASKTVIEQLLEAALEADRIKENSFSMDDIPKQLPLHRAFHRKEKSPANVVHLLSTGPARANLTTKDRRGQVPFHIACENDPGASAFRQLIDNDPDSVTFKLTDVLGQSPMDVLIRRIIDGDDKVLTSLQDLARADEKRRFFGDEDAKSRTLLDKLLATFPSADGNKHVRLSHVERKALFVIATCTPPGSGKYTLSLAKCQKMLEPFTFKKIYSDIHFHKTLNNLMCKRSFTFYFMLDLFVRILLVVFFTISTNHAMDGNIDHWSFVLVYLCSAYLMAWQVKLVLNHQLFYFREVWNVLDLLTQVLVIVSVGLLNSGKENEGSFRALNVLVGGLVWFIIVTGALRSTFLPFSVFVSGFTMVRHVTQCVASIYGCTPLLHLLRRLFRSCCI